MAKLHLRLQNLEEGQQEILRTLRLLVGRTGRQEEELEEVVSEPMDTPVELEGFCQQITDPVFRKKVVR